MFKNIPGFCKYVIDENGVIKNRVTNLTRKHTSIETVTLIGDDGIVHNRTVNSLMRAAGFKRIWIDPEEGR